MTMNERKTIDLEQGWEFMQKGITRLKNILEGLPEPQFSSGDYMMRYTTIYNMCTQKPPHDYSQQLYDKYRESFEEYITSTVLPSLREKHDEFMLRELVKRWANHKVMVRWLFRFFHYLDRYFIARRSLPPLNEVGLTCFRELVYQELNAKVRDAVISLIDQEREGEQIDRALLKNVLDIFVEIGMGQMDYYENDFEATMLKDTAAYYSRKASNWILDDSCPDYMLKAEECLKREKDTGEDDSSRNLIVNYLPSTLTPAAFKNMFTPFGEIESCRIIYDKATGSSQGYGFVKYKTEDASLKAVQVMNGQVVENKTLKVSLAKPTNPSMQQANLYVANLPAHYSKADLESMFANYGAILETKIMLDPATGVSRGAGFVRFASKEHALVAIDNLHNQVPLGADRPIVVRFSDSRDDKVRKGKAPPAFGFGRGQLRYNPMAAAAAPAANAYDLYSTMYAQTTPDMSQAAATGFMYPQMAAAAAAPAATMAYCLFVYNLPTDADEGLLYRLFGPFGAVSDVKIMREASTNRCKGFGFVHYLKLEDAQQAIISMNGYQLGDKYLQVSFKKQK